MSNSFPLYKTVIYISKTIVEYDEYDNIISQNVYYDKEVKYNNVEPKYEQYKNDSSYTSPTKSYTTSPYTSHTTSPYTSRTTSPFSSLPTSPSFKPDSVIIDMTKLSHKN